MNRRSFLAGATAGAVISTLDWLRFFRSFGVPGTARSLGLAEAAAQANAPEPRYLVYWFQEGGWDSYSMFSPVDTRNDAGLVIPAGELRPNPSWSSQFYRPTGYGTAPLVAPRTEGNITYGFLAEEGKELFGDMAVVSSHHGNTFHSGGRFDYHYGRYGAGLSRPRGSDERTVLQAFAEAYGANQLLAHVAWHRWLSDGELSFASYPEGTGYYEKLGPAYAHTQYGGPPAQLRTRLGSLGNLTGNARASRIRRFVDDLHGNFLRDKEGESVRAFQSAVSIHKSLTGGAELSINPATLFTDPALREEFGIRLEDENTTATSVNGNPARSKESPNANVQAMMAYELMRAGLSSAFHIEARQVRGFDSHRDRQSIMRSKGQRDQTVMMRNELWAPLKAFVRRLRSTPAPGGSGKSLFDCTTIVLASEMGRTIHGTVEDLVNDPNMTDDAKYRAIMEQDCCQHWKVNSVAFLGGTVRGNTQWGRVGSTTHDAIPILPDGTLDPAFDPVTGKLKTGATKAATSFVPDAGHVYSTALALSGLDPVALKAAGKGKNDRPALSFVKKA